LVKELLKMKILEGTSIVNVEETITIMTSSDYYIADELEKKSAEQIIKQRGSCVNIRCEYCPLYIPKEECISTLKLRVQICKMMLETPKK